MPKKVIIQGLASDLLQFKTRMGATDGEIDEDALFDENEQLLPGVAETLKECKVKLILEETRRKVFDGWTAGTDTLND